MLRYVNARTASLLAARAESQVLFNYLGRMPHAVPDPGHPRSNPTRWQPIPMPISVALTGW